MLYSAEGFPIGIVLAGIRAKVPEGMVQFTRMIDPYIFPYVPSSLSAHWILTFDMAPVTPTDAPEALTNDIPLESVFFPLLGSSTRYALTFAMSLAAALAVDCAAVAVDCADRLRTGACAALFERAAHTLNIDHHGTNAGFAQVNWVERAGATGELIYRLLLRLLGGIDRETASLLYVALATDTGNFSYSNASPETFRTAAALLECGIDLPELNRRLFRTVPYRKRLLEARAVSRCALHEGGRIALAALSLADFAACGADAADAEGLIDLVEIAALRREQPAGGVHVSLRGKRAADVSRIAVRFGGGGHRLAAGCVLEQPLDAAAQAILEAARAALPAAQEAR